LVLPYINMHPPGRTCVPHPEPPPTSFPIPSLWVISVHQPQASCILQWTWTGDSFLIWYYTCFNAILPNHPPPPPKSPKDCFTHLCLFCSFTYRVVIQFSSVAQSCPTLCNPMNRSRSGLPVCHQLPEFTQTHVHRVSDAIQPSHPLSSPAPPAPNPSQHQSLFQWVNSSHEVAKVLEFQL